MEYDNKSINRDGWDEWTNKPRVLENLLRNRHAPVTDADALARVVDWQLIDLEKRLDKFPGVKELNRHEVRDEVLRFHSSEGSRYDPYSKAEGNSSDALDEWKRLIDNDLDLIRTSQPAPSRSQFFEDRLTKYRDGVFELAESNLHVGVGSSRIEHARSAAETGRNPGDHTDHEAVALQLLALSQKYVSAADSAGQPAAPALPRLRPGNGAEFKGNKRARPQSGDEPPSKLRKLDERPDRDRGAIGVA